jgi:peptidoglycan/LPS O-acetylase OafA/YrhL
VLDSLRAVAALAVLWNHVTGPWADMQMPSWLSASGAHGWLGVPMFFVISGFVVPHALRAGRYDLPDYGRFLLKRMIRIDLPCYASAAIIVGLGLVGPVVVFETAPRLITWPQVVLHLGFLNYIFGFQFLNGVFWTLAIEFQYYLFIALVFPLIAARPVPPRLGVFVLLGGLAIGQPDRMLLFHYGFLFLLGIHTFQYVAGLVGRRMYWLLLVVLAGGALVTVEPESALIGTATAATIALLSASERRPWPGVGFLGRISYSLYLIHIPIGLRAIALLRPLARGPVSQVLVVLGGSATAVAAAWLLWLTVERPSQRWAARLRYREGGLRSGGAR